MRDFPVFATQHGAASLTLREIPYQGIAYIRLQETRDPEQLLRECTEFCVAVGAKTIYASGNGFLEAYPLHTEIWEMARSSDNLPYTNAELISVSMEKLDDWRSIYNQRMKGVANAATMTLADAQKHLDQGSGYYIYKDGVVIGIGVSQGDTIHAVISLVPGAGKDVLLALCTVLTGRKIKIEVASNNTPGVRLYERLGFQYISTASKWYRIK